MLFRLPHTSELENVVRGTMLNSLTAHPKNMMLSADVLKVCVSVIANIFHPEYIVKSSYVFDLGMFSCASGMLCFTLHFHDFVNALVKIVMWK